MSIGKKRNLQIIFFVISKKDNENDSLTRWMIFVWSVKFNRQFSHVQWWFLIFLTNLFFIFKDAFRKLKVWWPNATLFAFIFLYTVDTFKHHSFIHKHSLRPISISSQLSAQWAEPPWGAEPRKLLGNSGYGILLLWWLTCSIGRFSPVSTPQYSCMQENIKRISESSLELKAAFCKCFRIKIPTLGPHKGLRK